MRKFKLKKSTTNILLFNIMIALFILGSDTESLGLFIISKIIAGLIMIINSIILRKYSDIFED